MGLEVSTITEKLSELPNNISADSPKRLVMIRRLLFSNLQATIQRPRYPSVRSTLIRTCFLCRSWASLINVFKTWKGSLHQSNRTWWISRTYFALYYWKSQNSKIFVLFQKHTLIWILVIVHTTSHFKNADGTQQLRMCLGLRHINCKLQDSRYIILILKNLLNSVADAIIFSSHISYSRVWSSQYIIYLTWYPVHVLQRVIGLHTP